MSVARVVVDSALPHLDREFDYAIPDALADTVAVGSRVRVPFAGRLISAVVVALPDSAIHGVTLSSLRSSAALPSFTASGIDLARAVARRYGGSLWDVLRLMAPPRVASVERRDWSLAPDGVATRVNRLAAAHPVLVAAATVNLSGTQRGVWAATPTRDHAVLPAHELLAAAINAILVSVASRPSMTGASAIVVVPDSRALRTLNDACRAAGLEQWSPRTAGDFAVLDHDAGPAARYGAYLAAMTGQVPLVFGTRPAVLQPVPNLAFLGVWDEASDALLDAHAPHFHARTVAAMRGSDDDVRLILGGFAPGVDAAGLVNHGFATAILPDPGNAKAFTPAIEILDDARREREGGSGRHWMPSAAWRSLVDAASDAPVAILVPRAGYIQALGCVDCGTWATCSDCGGELALPVAGSSPTCRDCGAVHEHWHCAQCHGSRLNRSRQGVEAIAEQVRRMAPAIKVHLSSAASGVIDHHDATAGITVATPGALPAVSGGYATLVIVGAGTQGPGGLGSELVALRWWINAAALVRSRADGGVVLIVGEPLPHVRQALLTWDPWTAALEAYGERAALGLPPARRALIIEGDRQAIEAGLAARVGVTRVDGTPDVEASVNERRAVVLVSRGGAQGVVDAIRGVVVERSRAGATPLRLRVDAPLD